MGLFDIYSKRQKKLRGEIPDVYQYDDISKELRIQIVHIIRDTLGPTTSHSCMSNGVYVSAHKTLCKEYGKFFLFKDYLDSENDTINFLLNEKEIEKCLDVIEIFFKNLKQMLVSNICIFTYQSNHLKMQLMN